MKTRVIGNFAMLMLSIALAMGFMACTADNGHIRTTYNDLDGVPDSEDNCVGVFNPDQRDNDSDGLGDVCDEDIDNDGHVNDDDNCDYDVNAYQLDTDGDDWGNACDEDDDGDGVTDDLDNCLLTSNIGQGDIDEDGLGDDCDGDCDGDGTNDGACFSGDQDSDGYPAEGSGETPGDCNDGNAWVYPDALELCNGFDDNCYGGIDEGCGESPDAGMDAGSDAGSDVGTDVMTDVSSDVGTDVAPPDVAPDVPTTETWWCWVGETACGGLANNPEVWPISLPLGFSGSSIPDTSPPTCVGGSSSLPTNGFCCQDGGGWPDGSRICVDNVIVPWSTTPS
jgi:hypothetical protein